MDTPPPFEAQAPLQHGPRQAALVAKRKLHAGVLGFAILACLGRKDLAEAAMAKDAEELKVLQVTAACYQYSARASLCTANSELHSCLRNLKLLTCTGGSSKSPKMGIGQPGLLIGITCVL